MSSDPRHQSPRGLAAKLAVAEERNRRLNATLDRVRAWNNPISVLGTPFVVAKDLNEILDSVDDEDTRTYRENVLGEWKPAEEDARIALNDDIRRITASVVRRTDARITEAGSGA